MEEGHQLCQAIEEQFILRDREMNSCRHSLLDIGQDHVLAMRAADRKRWLQAVMLEREVTGHRGAQEQGHMQAAIESWLGSGWSMQESKEGSREVQGSIGARKQRGSPLREASGSQFGEEEHGTPE